MISQLSLFFFLLLFCATNSLSHGLQVRESKEVLWEDSPTELAQAIQTDMAVNRLTKHLNVNASRLLEEHQVKYENKTKHAGRRIRLTYMVVEAPAFELIE